MSAVSWDFRLTALRVRKGGHKKANKKDCPKTEKALTKKEQAERSLAERNLAERNLAEKDDTDICPICARPLGEKREKHHTIPKSKGGTETILIHPICHRKLHKVFKRTELVRHDGDITPVLENPEMQIFIRWLKGKPPDFYRRTR